MKKLLLLVLALFTTTAVFADDSLHLGGRVKDAITKRDLLKAYVLLYDSVGNVRDSIQCNKGYTWRNGSVDTISNFYFSVPRVDSVHVFDIVCEGYKDQTITYNLNKIGKREQWREIPLVLMERAPNQLKELTVTSTKIKFYNKGDTLVYNADAFQLAEGSMLDALISQLPGAELSDDGQIKVNGEFVESLLLNGKEFMDGNNNIMLENIAAYTVKDIQVYEGQTKRDKQMQDVTAPKVLTMDVRLKKEYNFGWLGNVQGGYGSEDRYLGRLFASWFNATTSVSLVGNINNLNDNRKPGKNDSWTPEQMPNGTKEFRQAGVDYNYEASDESKSARGSALFQQSINKTIRVTDRTNFLPGGDTYDYSRSNDRNRETAVQTYHSFYTRLGKNKKFNTGLYLNGSYNHSKNVNSALSGTFNKEQQGSTTEILDALYSDGNLDRFDALVNRSLTRSDGWTESLNGGVDWYSSLMLPGSGDRIYWDLGTKYTSTKNELWNDYDVSFGNASIDAIRRRRYTDNTPNHRFDVTGSAGYSINTSKGLYISFNYDYRFTDRTKDSYMYALERLNDMGIYGVVPSGYLEAFDPGNSYTSRRIENHHSLTPSLYYWRDFSKTFLTINFSPEFKLTHRHLDYYRNDQDYRYAHTNFTLNINNIWTGRVEFGFNKQGEGRMSKYRNSMRYSYRINPTLPNVEDLIDIVNDSDPMNIYLGNPGLKTQVLHAHLFRWQYSPFSHSLTNVLYLGYNHTTNNLTRGYTYDTETGVRYNRMYNVNGNNRAAITNELSWQFGSKKQFTLSSNTDIVSTNYTDMIGTNAEMPEFTKVHQNSFTENVKLGWQIGKQTLQARCDYTTRHTTSSQPGFQTLNAYHVNYGVSGVFSLPAGFGISTDFMCYTRRGYGSAQLDTTDPIWNARLTFSPVRNKNWVFTLDGFDLLHRLSNVTYAVTASGRTVAYTNALPRYVLGTIQYRFSIQPRK